MYGNQMVDPKLIEKWAPVMEGQGDWKEFVSACPKVQRKDYGALATMFESTEKYIAELTAAADGTGTYSPILIPMLRRVMPALIGPQIFGTQPLSAPSQLIFILRTLWQNDSVNPVTRANSVVLTLASAAAFTVGGDIVQGGTSTGTGVGIVRHKENNNILVEVVSGTFVAGAGEQVDNANPYVAAESTIAALYENEEFYHIIFSNYTGSYTTAAGEVLAKDMKEVGFKVDTENVTSKTRKLKAKWTHEVEQDFQAIHKMSAEALLSSVAADQIIQEMNREMIDLVKSKSTYSSAFDFSTADGLWEMQKYQNLAAAINRGKRYIATRSKRGQGSYMIVSPSVLNALESSGRLKDTNVDPVQKVYAGTALGMDVFVDLYATNDSVYIGYKASEIEAPIYYCPYVPLQIRKGQGEEDGQPRAFFSTRYGLKDNPFGAANYLHTLTVANLPA